MLSLVKGLSLTFYLTSTNESMSALSKVKRFKHLVYYLTRSLRGAALNHSSINRHYLKLILPRSALLVLVGTSPQLVLLTFHDKTYLSMVTAIEWTLAPKGLQSRACLICLHNFSYKNLYMKTCPVKKCVWLRIVNAVLSSMVCPYIKEVGQQLGYMFLMTSTFLFDSTQLPLLKQWIYIWSFDHIVYLYLVNGHSKIMCLRDLWLIIKHVR